MTIMQVCAYSAPCEGNFIKSLRALEIELGRNGHKTIYVFPEKNREIEWCKEIEKRTEVYYLPLAKARIKLSTYHKLSEIFRKHPDIGIVHSHFELYDVPVAMTAPKIVKVFWHLHDALEIYSSLRHRITHKLQYGFFSKRAVLLSVSEKHMEYVIRCGFEKNRSRYVPNGVDTNAIHLVKSDVDKRKYDFLMFGWEYERKGVDLCIQAVQSLNRPVRVAIVGIDDTRKKIVEQFGKVRGLEVVGFVTDINTLYEESGCFLHISRAEGLSYALLEAVYAGLPVICSDIRENLVAKDFPTVTMVKNEDAKSVCIAMKKQLENPRILAEKVTEVRNLIEKEYSISGWVKAILRQYGV